MNNFLSSPAPGFDTPLEMLRACHDRILAQLDTLSRLGAHLGEHGLDEAARTAAKRIAHYFNTAGDHHHRDEEEDLFPLLEGDREFAALLARLRSDHAEMARSWQRLAPLLSSPEQIADLAEFERLAADLRSRYTAHIAVENQDLLPRAAKVLTAAQLQELGTQMARRRGVQAPW